MCCAISSADYTTYSPTDTTPALTMASAIQEVPDQEFNGIRYTGFPEPLSLGKSTPHQPSTRPTNSSRTQHHAPSPRRQPLPQRLHRILRYPSRSLLITPPLFLLSPRVIKRLHRPKPGVRECPLHRWNRCPQTRILLLLEREH